MTRVAAWLVPAPIRGSGGHRTIFQNLRALAAAGWECHVYLEPPGTRAEAESYFGSIPATFHSGFEIDRDADVGFATAWFTAAALRSTARVRHKIYFVQDYEALFQPMGDAFVRAQNSFRYGFAGITIGRWLEHRLGAEFGMACGHFDFCADRSVYHPREVAKERAICFLHQPDKPRRCSGLGAEALAIVKRELPEVKIYLYGSDEAARVPYAVEQLGLLSVAQCAELYSRCAVGLCISTTNPSRIPFEMMATGLPVVDLYGENNRYDLPDDAVLLAEPTPESIASALLRLLRDPAGCANRGRAGLAFMSDRDLPRGLAQFTELVDRLVAGGELAPAAALDPIYRKPPVIASPDEMARFAEVLVDWPAPEASPSDNGAGPNGSSLLTRTRRRLGHTLRVLLTGR